MPAPETAGMLQLSSVIYSINLIKKKKSLSNRPHPFKDLELPHLLNLPFQASLSKELSISINLSTSFPSHAALLVPNVERQSKMRNERRENVAVSG